MTATNIILHHFVRHERNTSCSTCRPGWWGCTEK